MEAYWGDKKGDAMDKQLGILIVFILLLNFGFWLVAMWALIKFILG